MYETQENIKTLLNKIALKCLYTPDDWKVINYESRDVFYVSFLINHITGNFLIKDFLKKRNSPFQFSISEKEFEKDIIIKRAKLLSQFILKSTNLDLKVLADSDLEPLWEQPSYIQKRLEILFLTFLSYDTELDTDNNPKSKNFDYNLEDVKNSLIILIHILKWYIHSNNLDYSYFKKYYNSLEEYVILTTNKNIHELFQDNSNFKLL